MSIRKKVVVLTGAGISAESGISTFRDANGLWENHDLYEVATPEGFRKNPKLVYEFYNQRRKQLLSCEPNVGHKALVQLETHYDVQIITQNVDDLHERAGSSQILHLHGELRKVRSTVQENLVLDWDTDLTMEHKDSDGHALRPHIVWFGEDVPKIKEAIEMTRQADILIVIGTSLQVYPAADLVHYTKNDIPKFIIDPKADNLSTRLSFEVIRENASVGVPSLVKKLIHEPRN